MEVAEQGHSRGGGSGMGAHVGEEGAGALQGGVTEVRVRIVHCFNAFVNYEGNIGRVKEKHREQEGKT